jgi:GxxExxY protein
MEVNELTYKIRGAVYKVHKSLGPGLFESVYEAALQYELKQLGFYIQNQVSVPVNYNGVQLEIGFRLDLLVENEVIIEIKSVEALQDVHKKQLLTYLRLTKKKLGCL